MVKKQIRFEIIDVSFEEMVLDKFPLKKRGKYPFAFIIKPISYTTKSSTEGVFTFKFLLETSDTNRIHLEGKAKVLSDKQNELKTLLNNKNKKLENRIFEKVLYSCFLESKEILEEEQLPFPEIEWIFKQIRKYKKRG